MSFFRLGDCDLPGISLIDQSNNLLRRPLLRHLARFQRLTENLSWRTVLQSSRHAAQLSAVSALVLICPAAHAQQSNGLTFYHLADSATTKDAGGNLLPGIKAGPQTDGKVVAFISGADATACGATSQLYTVPVNGGALSTLVSTALQVEAQEPSGTTTVVCGRPVLGASTLYYPAYYTPTGGTQRSGIFQIPLSGGASADGVASGDFFFVNNVRTPVTNVYSGGTHNGTTYSANFTATTDGLLLADVSVTPPGTSNPLFTQYSAYYLGAVGSPYTITCPGVTLSGPFASSLSNEGGLGGTTVGFQSGINTANLPGQTPNQVAQFIVVNPSTACGGAVFTPNWGSATGLTTTYILPGEPAPTSSNPIAAMSMNTLTVSNGIVYLSARQTLSDGVSTYSGIFTVPTSGGMPPNGIYPSSRLPLTKVISNYDAIPGINLTPTACPGGTAYYPSMGLNFVVAGNYLVFTENQTVQNCSTMALSSTGGTYSLNLTTQAVQLILPNGAPPVPGDSGFTAFAALLPGAISQDGHLAFVVSNTSADNSTVTATLYSTYLPQVVTAVSLTAPVTSNYGGSVALTAKVSPNTGAASSATGIIKFLDGATILGTSPIDSTGTAALTLTNLAVGTHAVQALYSGDVLYEGASSATASLITAKSTSTLTLTASATTVTVGQPVILTAQLASPGGTPTGQVTFTSGTTTIGTATVGSTGAAALTVPTFSTGITPVTASYTGDANFSGSQSSALNITAAKSTSTLTLTASATTVTVGQPVILTAQLASAGGTPTGQVTFTSGTTTLGTATVGSTGAAALTVPTFSAGITPVTASYNGDANFSGSLSSALNITAGVSDYTITASPATATITAGQSATFVFTVTPAFGFSSPITFSCGTLPSEAACSFAPATVTPGSGPVTSTLTITTTAQQVSSSTLPLGLFRTGGISGICLAVMLAWFPKRLRHKQRWTLFILFTLLSAGVLGVSGCSGGSPSSKVTDPGTTKGTATVTVSATAGSGSGASSHTASIAVIVQ